MLPKNKAKKEAAGTRSAPAKPPRKTPRGSHDYLKTVGWEDHKPWQPGTRKTKNGKPINGQEKNPHSLRSARHSKEYVPTMLDIAFVEYYVAYGNAKQAYTEAHLKVKGVAPGSGVRATAAAYRHKPWVRDEILKRQKTLAQKLGITQERILRSMGNLAFSNMEDYVTIDKQGRAHLDLSAMQRDESEAVTSITTKKWWNKAEGGEVTETTLKLAPKKEALETLGRYLGIKGFGTSRVEHTGADGGPIQLESIPTLTDAVLESIVLNAEIKRQSTMLGGNGKTLEACLDGEV